MTITSPPERAKLINELAVEVARHRMSDTRGLLSPEEIVRDSDIALVLRLVRLSAPLHPLPTTERVDL